MSSSAGPQRETELLRMQVETFYQVNKFISSIDNLDELLNLIMQEAEAAVPQTPSSLSMMPSMTLVGTPLRIGKPALLPAVFWPPQYGGEMNFWACWR